jgi:hypothetical protein
MARGPLSPLPDQQSYAAWIPTNSLGAFMRFAGEMARTSVPLYWANAGEILVGWSSAKTLLLAAVFLLAGLGGAVLLAREFPALTASLIATLGVIVVWPYVQDRFLTPLVPVLGVAGGVACDRILTRAPVVMRRVGLAGVALVTVALVAANARLRAESARGSWNASSPYARAIAEMVDWVQRNTLPNDHIMTYWGGVIYFRTGRRTSIMDPEEPMVGGRALDAPNEFYATRLLADSVDYVIIWDHAPGRAATLLRAFGSRCPGALKEVTPARLTSSAATDVHYYHVQRDLRCLIELASPVHVRGG